MKKNITVLLFSFFISNSFMFCQVANDSLGGNFIYPEFNDDFSAEESWQIHKEAYIKQLNNKNLTASEIQNKIAAYEQQKNKFIKNIVEQRKKAAIQRQKAEKFRAQAEEQRKKADVQKQKAEKFREEAETQRNQAHLLRKQAEEYRSQNEVQSKQAEEQRKKADVYRLKAEEQRKKAAVHRLKAEEQRELADVQRQKAEKSREEAEKWRNSFEIILTKDVTISSQSANIKPIIVKVDKKATLRFNINGKISSGTTIIEIFNPSGKKEGELSLEHNSDSSLTDKSDIIDFTSGSLNKTISNADIGDWQIKISSNKSEGNIKLSVAYYKKPVMNE